MKNIPELSCAIVEDLLPTYVERLTSEETNMAVEAHLASCPACAAKRTAMGAGGGLHHAGAGGSDSYKNLHHWRAGTSQ